MQIGSEERGFDMNKNPNHDIHPCSSDWRSLSITYSKSRMQDRALQDNIWQIRNPAMAKVKIAGKKYSPTPPVAPTTRTHLEAPGLDCASSTIWLESVSWAPTPLTWCFLTPRLCLFFSRTWSSDWNDWTLETRNAPRTTATLWKGNADGTARQPATGDAQAPTSILTKFGKWVSAAIKEKFARVANPQTMKGETIGELWELGSFAVTLDYCVDSGARGVGYVLEKFQCAEWHFFSFLFSFFLLQWCSW